VIGSTLLGGTTVWAIILVAIIVIGVTSGQLWVLFSFVPAAIGLVSYLWTRITKSLRYSIAGTRRDSFPSALRSSSSGD